MVVKPSTIAWQQALIVLSGTVVFAAVITCLYLARIICIPVTLAIVFTFVLTQPVLTLQKRGMGRTQAVLVIVLLAGLLLGGVSWIVGSQITSLWGELPKYSQNIEDKIHSFQNLSKDSNLGRMIRRLTTSWNHPEEVKRDLQTPKESPEGSASTKEPPEQPTTVVVSPNEVPWLGLVPPILSAVLQSFAQAGLAVVLTIFMLLKREDLRNRFIRLAGHGHMTMTTKAVDDAGHRISRYLFTQLIINAAFGILVALGLFLIGVDYAILWGFLAGAMRYVPYVGTTVASLFPIALSLIQFSGWLRPILVLALILGLEFVMANVMEPRFYGQSIGVSEVGMLICAAFWAYMWGPIGLILSGPMTVCLVVLGKYVPRLEFFDVLLGDEPVLDPHVTFYQRLAAADPVEAVRVVQEYVQSTPRERVYDDLLVPALVRARRDRARDLLTDDDEKFVMETVATIVEDLKINVEKQEPTDQESEAGKREAGTHEPLTRQAAAAIPHVFVLGFPARVEADWVGLRMLERLLDPGKWKVEVVGDQWLSSELLAMAEKGKPDVVCIGSMPPGGLAHARYLCKRLRKKYPQLKIVVGRWGLKHDQKENRHLIQEAGADHVGFTLLETRDHLQSWLPILAQGNAAPKGGKRLKEEVGG